MFAHTLDAEKVGVWLKSCKLFTEYINHGQKGYNDKHTRDSPDHSPSNDPKNNDHWI